MINTKQLDLTHEIKFYPIDFNKLRNNNSKTNLIKHLKQMNKLVMDDELMLARDESPEKFPTYYLALDVDNQNIIVTGKNVSKYNSVIIAFHSDERINYFQNNNIDSVADNIINDYCHWLRKALTYENKVKNSLIEMYRLTMNAYNDMPRLFSSNSYTAWIINQIDTIKGEDLNMFFIYTHCSSLYPYLLLKKLPNCKQFYVSTFNLVLHYLYHDLTENNNTDNRTILLVKMLIKIINDNNIKFHYDENIDYECIYDSACALHYTSLSLAIEALLLIPKSKIRNSITKSNNTKVIFHLNNEKELNIFISQLLNTYIHEWDDANKLTTDICHELYNNNRIHIDNNLIQTKITLIKNNFKDAIILQKVVNVLENLNKNSV